MLISFAVTAKLICIFVFAYAKSWFSHDAAHFSVAVNVTKFWSLLILNFLLASQFLTHDFAQCWWSAHFHGILFYSLCI